MKQELCDYIAMDIKSSETGYAEAIGLNIYNASAVATSIEMMMQSEIDYEFRTTVVKGIHQYEDILAIGMTIKEAKKYVLQQYAQSEQLVPGNNFSFYSLAEMNEWKEKLEKSTALASVEIRGRY